MKGCIFITMKDSSYGFTLAGFQQLIADEGNVLEIMTKIVNSSDPGLVFIDERLLSERILGRLQLLEKQWGGAIISLPEPGRQGEPTGKDFGKRFISPASGLRRFWPYLAVPVGGIFLLFYSLVHFLKLLFPLEKEKDSPIASDTEHP